LNVEGPDPRTLQAAVFYKNFIVTFGGRNDKGGPNNYCLNDVMLLDLRLYKWQPIIVYGFVPSKRWGHTMNIKESSILMFGGVSESKLANSTVYSLELDKKYVKENIEECKKIKTILETQTKRSELFNS